MTGLAAAAGAVEEDAVVTIAEGDTAAAGVAEVAKVDAVTGLAVVGEVPALNVDSAADAEDTAPSADVTGLAAAAGPVEEVAVWVDALEVEPRGVTTDAVAASAVAFGTTAGVVAVAVDGDALEMTHCDVTGSIASIKELERMLVDVDGDAETAPSLDVNAGCAPALSLHRAQRRVSTKAPRRKKRARAIQHRSTSRACTRVHSNA